ncbi:MAG: hypothetical protein AAGA77_25695 [Bacteroidota bacterium]
MDTVSFSISINQWKVDDLDDKKSLSEGKEGSNELLGLSSERPKLVKYLDIDDIQFSGKEYSYFLIEGYWEGEGFGHYILNNFVKLDRSNKRLELIFSPSRTTYIQKKNDARIEGPFVEQLLPMDQYKKILKNILNEIYVKDKFVVFNEKKLNEYIKALTAAKPKDYIIYFFLGFCYYLKDLKIPSDDAFDKSQKLASDLNIKDYIKSLREIVFSESMGIKKKEKFNKFVFLFSPEETIYSEFIGASKFLSVVNSFNDYGLVLNTRKIKNKKIILRKLTSFISLHQNSVVILAGHASENGFILYRNGNSVKLTADDIDSILKVTNSKILLMDFACTDQHFGIHKYQNNQLIDVVYSKTDSSNSLNGEYYSFGFFIEYLDSYSILKAHLAGVFALSIVSDEFKNITLSDFTNR